MQKPKLRTGRGAGWLAGRLRMCLTAAMLILLAAGVSTSAYAELADGVLRVCADPQNLPFSNAKGEGFENKLAELVAAELHRPVEYTWWAQRRGFFRST